MHGSFTATPTAAAVDHRGGGTRAKTIRFDTGPDDSGEGSAAAATGTGTGAGGADPMAQLQPKALSNINRRWAC